MPYAQARAFLATLSDPELAAAMREAKLDLAVAVTDHVLTCSSPVSDAVLALAEAAPAGRTVVRPGNIIRSLIRLARPEVDRALFFAPASRAVWPARRAILADRRGADGRPVIDSELAERLLAALEAPVDTAPEGIPFVELVDAAALADDPRIARAALDAALRLDRPAAAHCALSTLYDYGLSEQGWADVRAEVERQLTTSYDPNDFYRLFYDEDKSRFHRLTPDWAAMLDRAREFQDSARYSWDSHGDDGLDAAAARDDMPGEVRAALEDHYVRALWLNPRPDIELLRRALADLERLPPIDRHAALAQLVRRGVVSGSLSVGDVVATVRPAAETLALLVPGNTAEHNCFRVGQYVVPEPASVWVADEIRAEVAEVLSVLGEEPAAWGGLWGRAMSWAGTLPELVAAVSGHGSSGHASPRPDSQPTATASARRNARTIDPVVALVSLAPPPVLDEILQAVPHDRHVAGAVAQMLGRRPLTATLIDFAFGPRGTPEMRCSLARNVAIDESMLWALLLREPAETGVLAEIFLRRDATADLRLAAVMRSHAAGGLHPVLAGHLRKTAPGADAVAAALVAGDPDRIHAAVLPVIKTIDPSHRALAYAALAAAAGPEPVWTLELARVGALAKAAPSVRASIADGDARALIAVVEQVRGVMEAKRREVECTATRAR